MNDALIAAIFPAITTLLVAISKCSPLFKKSENKKLENEEELYAELKEAVSSLYNWTRKEAGLTYDESKMKKYLPNNRRDQIIKTCKLFFPITVVFSALIIALIIAVRLTYSGQQSEDYVNCIIIFVLLEIAALGSVFFYQMVKKK